MMGGLLMFLNIWITIKTVRKIWKRVLLGGLGISIGFMLIFTSTIMGDSIYRSILEDNLQTLQETDIILFSEDNENGGFFNDSIINKIETDDELNKLIDAISGQLAFGVTLISSEQKTSTWGVLHGINVTIDQEFGSLQLGGEPLKEQQLKSEDDTINVVITKNIMETLNISRGDSLKIPFTLHRPNVMTILNVSVIGILDDVGRARSHNGNNIYVDIHTLQNSINLSRKINEIVISLNGDIVDGLDHEDKFLEALLSNIQNTDIWPELIIYQIKSNAIDEAKGGAKSISEFFGALGVIGIASALFLIGTIYYILLEERREDIAILRSLGMVKFDILKQFLLESLITGVIAGIIGVIGTIMINGMFLEALSSIYQPGFYLVGNVELSRRYTLWIRPESLIQSFTFGLLFVLAIATFASWRISSMNIIATFQELEIDMIQDTNRKKSVFYAFVSVALISLGIYYIQTSLMIFSTLFYIGTLVGLLFLYTWKKEKFKTFGTIYLVVILLPLVTLAIFITNNLSYDFEVFLFITWSVIYFLVMITILVLLQLDFITKLILKLSFIRSSHILMYCQGNIRKSKVKIFFSVIIFSLMITVMQGVIFFSNASYYANEAYMDKTWIHGADFRANLVFPINQSEWYQNLDSDLKKDIQDLAGWSLTKTSIEMKVGEKMERWYNYTKDESRVIGIDKKTRDLLNITIKGNSIFESEESVWTEFFNGKGVLVPYWFEYDDFQLQDITLHTDIGNTTIPVIGYIFSGFGSIFISKGLFESYFTDVKGANTLFVKLKPKVDIKDIDEKLKRSLNEWGLSLTNREEYLTEMTQIFAIIVLIFEGYFSIGVILAFIGLSLILYRNIQLRWHEFGILAAMGMTRAEIARVIFLESIIISILALIIGSSTSFIMLKPAVLGALQGTVLISSYSVDIPAVAFWTILVVFSSLIAALIPVHFLKKKKEIELIREIGL
jgi:ABC-type antimicrobial peptide transport system permease subunit